MYAFNLVGAMLGSLLTGFFVLPLLGAQHTLFALSTLNLVAAVLCLLPFPSHSRAGLVLPIAAGGVVLVVLLSAFVPRGLFEALFSRAYPGTTILESYEISRRLSRSHGGATGCRYTSAARIRPTTIRR